MKQHLTFNLALAVMSLCGIIVMPITLYLAFRYSLISSDVWILSSISSLAGISVIGIIWQFVSIIKLHRQSNFDSLTGLLNRTAFNLLFKQLIAKAEKDNLMFHMLLLDLNKFKQVNDTLGHEVGDQLLKVVASRLRNAVRQDDIIARLGGDEFAILVSDPDRVKSYEHVVARIIKTVNITTVVGHTSTYISVSVGIATFPTSGTSTNEITRRADIAMYSAKRTKQDFCIYRDEDDISTARELTLLGEIRTAIADDHFEVWYQPKVSTVNNSVTSAECLIRWRHPFRGIISPDQFIPLAESTGIIKNLTQVVIDKATHGYELLKESGHDLSLSINISPTNLIDPSIISTIIKYIVKRNMAPTKLILEVTETAFMHDTDAAVKVLIALESLGIKLSIDDFGTGYSSLLYLKNFPIHEIKLDRSFITDIVTNDIGFNIVKATINLAHELEATVVAEGVETKEIRDTIADLGCDFIQGYYIAKPMPFDEFVESLDNYEKQGDLDE